MRFATTSPQTCHIRMRCKWAASSPPKSLTSSRRAPVVAVTVWQSSFPRLGPEEHLRVAQVVREVLEGTILVTKELGIASATLIPKFVGAIAPGSFRPITVLPVMLKLAMRTWLELASPYLYLRRALSHGVRPGFQAAEVHLIAGACR